MALAHDMAAAQWPPSWAEPPPADTTAHKDKQAAL
jgi:hypothetical protein